MGSVSQSHDVQVILLECKYFQNQKAIGSYIILYS
jgi:hypothetical protein